MAAARGRAPSAAWSRPRARLGPRVPETPPVPDLDFAGTRGSGRSPGPGTPRAWESPLRSGAEPEGLCRPPQSPGRGRPPCGARGGQLTCPRTTRHSAAPLPGRRVCPEGTQAGPGPHAGSGRAGTRARFPAPPGGTLRGGARRGQTPGGVNLHALLRWGWGPRATRMMGAPLFIGTHCGRRCPRCAVSAWSEPLKAPNACTSAPAQPQWVAGTETGQRPLSPGRPLLGPTGASGLTDVGPNPASRFENGLPERPESLCALLPPPRTPTLGTETRAYPLRYIPSS